jgi:hypothetical protein
LLLLLPFGVHAQVQRVQPTPESVRGFVQGFYDWYVPKALDHKIFRAWDLALKTKSSVFSPELAQALREDSAAQDKAEKGELVGLDFDPFLNSQDPRPYIRRARSHRKGRATGSMSAASRMGRPA